MDETEKMQPRDLLFYSPWRNFWRSYRANYLAFIALCVLVALILIGVLAPLISAHSPHRVGVGEPFASPSLEFTMGTDKLGRDVFSRVLWGARVSLFVGFAAAAASTFLGVIIGTISGFLGGRVDDMLMRVTELFQVIPRFFLALLLVSLFGANIWNIIIAIGILSWPVTARLVRSEFLSLKKRHFVDAAKMQGSSSLTIILIEILPNASGVIIVNSTLMVAQAMLLEAGLSYLGMGDPSTVSWGLMLYQAQSSLMRAWWIALFPGLGIFLSVLALNLVGDGLNDVLNPRAQDVKEMVL